MRPATSTCWFDTNEKLEFGYLDMKKCLVNQAGHKPEIKISIKKR